MDVALDSPKAELKKSEIDKEGLAWKSLLSEVNCLFCSGLGDVIVGNRAPALDSPCNRLPKGYDFMAASMQSLDKLSTKQDGAISGVFHQLSSSHSWIRSGDPFMGCQHFHRPLLIVTFDLSNRALFVEGNCDIDALQPTQPLPSVPCLPISDPQTSGPNISPTYADPNSWMNDVYNNGYYPGGDVDRVLDVYQRADKGMLFMTRIQLLSVPLSRLLGYRRLRNPLPRLVRLGSIGMLPATRHPLLRIMTLPRCWAEPFLDWEPPCSTKQPKRRG